jgi:hypothetical protein
MYGFNAYSEQPIAASTSIFKDAQASIGASVTTSINPTNFVTPTKYDYGILPYGSYGYGKGPLPLFEPITSSVIVSGVVNTYDFSAQINVSATLTAQAGISGSSSVTVTSSASIAAQKVKQSGSTASASVGGTITGNRVQSASSSIAASSAVSAGSEKIHQGQSEVSVSTTTAARAVTLLVGSSLISPESAIGVYYVRITPAGALSSVTSVSLTVARQKWITEADPSDAWTDLTNDVTGWTRVSGDTTNWTEAA